MQALRVLLVEDAEDDAWLILRELRRGGFEAQFERVDTLPNLRAALARGPWQIVLSDYCLPRCTGLDAFQVVIEHGGDIPFILVSGKLGETVAVDAMRAGVHDYVFKENLQRLCPAISRELREAATRAEQRAMREQLLLSERLASVGLVAAGVVHEINNPLTALLGNLQLAERTVCSLADSAAPPLAVTELQVRLQHIHDAAERVAHVVRDASVFTRPERGETFVLTDVHAALESSLHMASHEIVSRAHVVRVYVETPPVGVPEARLGQVFLNLFLNAAHAIVPGRPADNEIRVSTSVVSDAEIQVEVSDTGAGIPESLRPSLFKPFTTTKLPGAGTGLGLFVSKRILMEAGGKIDFMSQVGVGTTFRVVLPVAGQQTGLRSIPPSAAFSEMQAPRICEGRHFFAPRTQL